MNISNQKGFTLVELSIVLVIIGLLIGGILAAQSMINTAKVQAFTRQIGQFDAAVATFKDRFKGVPGDVTSINADGDGNGIVEDDGGTSMTYADEVAGVWPSLSATGLKNESGTAYTNTDDAPTLGESIPKAKLGLASTGLIMAFDDSATAADSGHFYYAADFNASDATNIAYALAFTGTDALAFDTKIDDGDSNAGNVYAEDAAGGAVAGLADFTAAGCPNAYTTGDSAAYVLRIRVGGSTTGILM